MMSDNVEPDPERQQKAKQYARISRRLWLVNLLITGIYTVAWLVLGWSTALRQWLSSLSPALSNPWLLVPAFLFVFGGILVLIGLPLDYYSGFVLPHRFGQSTQSLRDWVVDQLKGLAIGLPLGLVMIELFYL